MTRFTALLFALSLVPGCTSWQTVDLDPAPSAAPRASEIRGDFDASRLLFMRRPPIRLRLTDGTYSYADVAYLRGDSVIAGRSIDWMTLRRGQITALDVRRRSARRTALFAATTLVLMAGSAILIGNLESCVETATVTCGGY